MTDDGRRGLFVSVFLFYAVLLVNYQFPSLSISMSSRTFLLCLGSLTWIASVIGFYRTPWTAWVLTFLVLIPLEFSAPFLFIRSFSPIDYLGFAAILALLAKLNWGDLWRRLSAAFGKVVIALWGAFFSFAVLSSLYLHGNPLKDFRWVFFLLTYFVTWNAAQEESSENLQNKVCFLASVLGGLIGAVALLQFVHHHMDFMAATATFGQHNSVGAYLSLCLPLSISSITAHGKNRLSRYGLAFLCTAGLIVSYSRGAMLGLVIGVLLLYGIPYFKHFTIRHVVLLASGILVLGVLSKHFLRHDLNGRNFYWAAGLEILRAHPLVGLGPGNYATHIKDYLTGDAARLYRDDVQFHRRLLFWLNLHNLYLQILVEHGLVGGCLFLFAFAGIICKAFGRADNDLKNACCVSIIGFLVHNVFDITAVSSFEIFVGILIALAQIDSREKNAHSFDSPH